ncbi:MAG: ATP-binding protein [Egibacteraceae bacterium]
MRLPIRTRLTLISGALMGALLVAMGAFIYLRLQVQLMAAVDAGLSSRAETLAQAADRERLLGGPTIVDPTDAFAQLLTPDGQVLESSPGLAAGPLVTPAAVQGLRGPRFFDVQAQTVEEPVPARVLAVPSTDGSVILVAASLDDQREALATLRALLAVAGPAAVALASGVGWLVAGTALRPVDRMRVEAEAISGSEPGRRLPVPATGDELTRLGDSLNRMLGRLEDAMERERRFVDDASHELRTPLANLKAELELALRRARPPQELLESLRSAAEEVERLTRLAQDLLILARADRGRLLARPEAHDVAALVRATVDSFAGRAAGLGIALETSIEGPLPARIDADRVRQAVGNLIDNALRHSCRGGTVTVSAARQDAGLAITVADTGEGFPPAFLPAAFEAFSRADAARARGEGGAGLGLAIVRAVAEAHGGSVEAANRPHTGAMVVMRIPA